MTYEIKKNNSTDISKEQDGHILMGNAHFHRKHRISPTFVANCVTSNANTNSKLRTQLTFNTGQPRKGSTQFPYPVIDSE